MDDGIQAFIDLFVDSPHVDEVGLRVSSLYLNASKRNDLIRLKWLL